MSIATDGFGTIVAGLESGGGGGTVIPDGGTVGGEYVGNVLCAGDVTVTSNLYVDGSMVVLGDFTNSGGFEVQISGDLHAQNVDFDRTIKTSPQSNFGVNGNLIFTSMSFRQCGGSAATLRVGGNLIGAIGFSGSYLYGDGETDATSGLNILVYGDMRVAYTSIDGYSSAVTTSGNGGSCVVYGSFTLWDSFLARGGNGTSGCNGGDGGFLEVYGDLSGDAFVVLAGGDSNGGNAGNGGTIEVGGNATAEEFAVFGGYCYSDSEVHRSGGGGSVYVKGNLTLTDYFNVSGGNREGNLTASSSESSPDGGFVSIGGNFVIDGDVAGRGGDVLTNGGSPHQAGSGATFYIYGNVVCSDDFRAYGGQNTNGSGGGGGYLDVEGSLHVDDELEFYGGYGGGGSGGSGGQLYVGSHADIGYLDFSGNSGYGGYGGGGGTINVNGHLSLQDQGYANGGNCDSANYVQYPGSGGSFVCYGLTSGTTIYLQGGDRYGSTTSSTNNPPASGGSFYCYGTARANGLNLNGGSVYTTYPNARGGNGGNLLVYGPLYLESSTTLNGGSSVGRNGGNAGILFAQGTCTMTDLYATGGAANDSTGVGGDAAINGCAGTVTFRSGVTANLMEMLDGNGVGSASTLSSQIRLSGPCYIATISMTDRPDCWIYGETAVPVSLRTSSLVYKRTLNTNIGTPTVDVVASGFINNGTFISGLSGGSWYVHTGFSL